MQAANEYESVFAATYALNHPETTVVAGNVLDPHVRAELLAAGRGVDVVAGGPPCQGFSTVGKKDENDPRNKLFYAFLEIIGALRPRVGSVSKTSAASAACTAAGLPGLATRAGRSRLCGPALGDPERHGFRRAAIAGADLRRGVPGTNPVPFTRTDARQIAGELFRRQPALTLEDALSDLPVVASGESADRYRGPPQNGYQNAMRKGAGKTLTEQDGPWHGERLLSVLAHVPAGGSILDVPEELRPQAYFANTYSRLWWDRPSTTITRNLGTPSSSRCIHPQVDRGLTTREGARLQSFPDAYRFTGSRIQKNLQIGNAVPPLLARALGKEIFRALAGT